MDGKLKAFIRELEELTNKHGIEIASCGCCGSPYLLGLDAEFHVLADELTFDRETKTYGIKEPESGAYQYKFEMFNQDGTKIPALPYEEPSDAELKKWGFTEPEIKDFRKDQGGDPHD